MTNKINLTLTDILPSNFRQEDYHPSEELLSRIAQLNQLFETTPTPEILAWAISEFPTQLALLSALEAESMVIIHMLHTLQSEITIYNLDTGYQFPETLDMVNKIAAKYHYKVIPWRPSITIEEYEAAHSGPIYAKDPEQCCHDRKIKPFLSLLNKLDAWISGIRREQSPTRANAPFISWDNISNNIKINPIVNWTRQQVWDYIHEHDIPYNQLYDQGYLSIGCWPCTKAVTADQDERAGRWTGFNKTECGLHFTNKEESN